MMPDPTQGPNSTAWLPFAGFGLTILGLGAGIARWVTARVTKEALEPVNHAGGGFYNGADKLEKAIESLVHNTSTLPEIRSIAEKAVDSLERLERSTEGMAANMLVMTKEIGELKGASQRTRAD